MKRTAIRAPRETVWTAWTERTELAKWFGYDANVELRLDGPYEILFLKDNPPGLRGGEGNRITSFCPGRLLTFTWNAPPTFGPLRDVRTFVMVELRDLPEGGTEVTLTHYGWRTGEDWQGVYDYFDNAWSKVMEYLKGFLEPAPAS